MNGAGKGWQRKVDQGLSKCRDDASDGRVSDLVDRIVLRLMLESPNHLWSSFGSLLRSSSRWIIHTYRVLKTPRHSTARPWNVCCLIIKERLELKNHMTAGGEHFLSTTQRSTAHHGTAQHSKAFIQRHLIPSSFFLAADFTPRTCANVNVLNSIQTTIRIDGVWCIIVSSGWFIRIDHRQRLIISTIWSPKGNIKFVEARIFDLRLSAIVCTERSDAREGQREVWARICLFRRVHPFFRRVHLFFVAFVATIDHLVTGDSRQIC